MAKYGIKIDQGATFELAFWWRESLADAAGDLIRDEEGNAIPASPIDLTGYTARMMIRKTIKDASPMLSLTSSPPAGIVVNAPVVLMKPYVKCATTPGQNLDLTGAETLDGIAVVTGDRVLVKDQTTATQNGIYVVNSSGAWTRATDADTAAEVTLGACVWVWKGSIQHDSVWRQTLAVANIATDSQSWQETTQVGRVDVLATDEQTAALTSSGVYDLELESPGGRVYRPLEGKMRLSAEVTR